MKDLNTVLLIEDDRMIRQMLREVLENDFVVLESALGERSFDILEHHDADIILMDLNLPDGCGFDFIKRIKNKTNVPLVILSGEKDEQKKVRSFEVGADDFVSKPFSIDLLTARLKAHIRRAEEISLNSTADALKPHPCLKINEWTLDRMKFQLFDQENHPADLTTREFELLNYLVENAGRAIPREELCDAIREDNYVPTPRALDVKITRIRKKIGDNAATPDIIQTVRGVGYMFNKDVIMRSKEA